MDIKLSVLTLKNIEKKENELKLVFCLNEKTERIPLYRQNEGTAFWPDIDIVTLYYDGNVVVDLKIGFEGNAAVFTNNGIHKLMGILKLINKDVTTLRSWHFKNKLKAYMEEL